MDKSLFFSEVVMAVLIAVVVTAITWMVIGFCGYVPNWLGCFEVFGIYLGVTLIGTFAKGREDD